MTVSALLFFSVFTAAWTPTPAYAQAGIFRALNDLGKQAAKGGDDAAAAAKTADEATRAADAAAQAATARRAQADPFTEIGRQIKGISYQDAVALFEQRLMVPEDATTRGWYIGDAGEVPETTSIATRKNGDVYIEPELLVNPETIAESIVTRLDSATPGQVNTPQGFRVRVSPRGARAGVDIEVATGLYVDSRQFVKATSAFKKLAKHAVDLEDTKVILGFDPSEQAYFAPIERATQSASVAQSLVSDADSLARAVRSSWQKTLIVVAHQENTLLMSRPVGGEQTRLGTLEEVREAALATGKRLIVLSCRAGNATQLTAPLRDVRPSQVGERLDVAFRSSNLASMMRAMSAGDMPMRLDIDSITPPNPMSFRMIDHPVAAVGAGGTLAAAGVATAASSDWSMHVAIPPNDEEYRRSPSLLALLFGALAGPGLALCVCVRRNRLAWFGTLAIILTTLFIINRSIYGQIGVNDSYAMVAGCSCLAILPTAIVVVLIRRRK